MMGQAIAVRGAVQLRRAQPWLGTLVDISAEGADAASVEAAIAAAFNEIAAFHRLMSPQEPASDLSRINSAPLGTPVRVDARTADVLRAAAAMGVLSGGVFDCTAGGSGRRAPVDGPGWHIDGAGVCVRTADVRIDLGGIAKGAAVDRALAVLRARGMHAALVNAGGDLAHFGERPVEVGLRDPEDAGRCSGVARLANGALASSASHRLGDAGDKGASALVDPRTGNALLPGIGVSVAAPSCMLADALTKVVLVSGDAQHAALALHGAQVLQHVGRPALP